MLIILTQISAKSCFRWYGYGHHDQTRIHAHDRVGDGFYQDNNENDGILDYNRSPVIWFKLQMRSLFKIIKHNIISKYQ